MNWRITGKNTIGGAQFIAGSMRRPDTFNWHWGATPGELIITGLWRGAPRYGTLRDTVANILKELAAHDCQQEIKSIRDAIDAQGERAPLYYGSTSTPATPTMPRFNPIRGVPPPAAPPINREDLITKIAGASIMPCLPVVPSISNKGMFCYYSNEGTYVGKAFPTAEAAREAWDNHQLDNAAKFAEELAKMDDARLQSQADYWLKERAKANAENLKTEKRKSKSDVSVSESQRLSISIKQTTHTKHGYPIWIAQLADKVTRPEFTRLLKIAKAGGGYWSSFGPVEIHGFIFKEEAKATAFQTLVNPATEAPTEKFDVGRFQVEQRVRFMPRARNGSITTGLLREFINDGEGCHIVAPLPGDPTRVVRVWANDGLLEDAPVEPTVSISAPANEPEKMDMPADPCEGRTIWNSDGMNGPCLICPPPEAVAVTVAAPVIASHPVNPVSPAAWRRRF